MKRILFCIMIIFQGPNAYALNQMESTLPIYAMNASSMFTPRPFDDIESRVSNLENNLRLVIDEKAKLERKFIQSESELSGALQKINSMEFELQKLERRIDDSSDKVSRLEAELMNVKQ